MTNYEREFGRPVPDGYIEVADVNKVWKLERADGCALSDHEIAILFAQSAPLRGERGSMLYVDESVPVDHAAIAADNEKFVAPRVPPDVVSALEFSDERPPLGILPP